MTDADPTELAVIRVIDQARRQHAQTPLLVGLVLLIAIGAVGTWASVSNARATNAASRADVMRNADLTRQLTELTEKAAHDAAVAEAAATAYRIDTRRIQLAVCAQVEALAGASHVAVPACPPITLTAREGHR